MEFIRTENDGQNIVRTSYYNTAQAAKGYVHLSINAGAFRLLVPDRIIAEIEEWKTAREVIISRGPWPDENQSDALEILFEDGSDYPYALHIVSAQVDRMPRDADRDRRDQPPRWIFAVWTRDGKELELPCRYRLVKRLPWLKAW